MDFVVSKVAMAVCALLVATVLAGLFAEGALLRFDSGFERVLDEFCDLVERASTGESSISWRAPFLPSGEGVTISIDKGTVLAESGDGTAARRPLCGLHLWRSDGRPLNESAVDALDNDFGSLVFDSGQTVDIVAQRLVYENEPRVLVFVYLLG